MLVVCIEVLIVNCAKGFDDVLFTNCWTWDCAGKEEFNIKHCFEEGQASNLAMHASMPRYTSQRKTPVPIHTSTPTFRKHPVLWLRKRA